MKINAKTIYGLITLLFLVIFFYYGTHTYRGDGRFTNNGFMAAAERYIIDFGEIDLSSQKTYTYKIRHLPYEDFTVGIYITALQEQDKPIYDTKKINPLVHLAVVSDKGELVIDQKKNLNQWIWSGRADKIDQSFIYVRGDKTLDVSAHGRGTHFRPRLLASYTLTLDVIEPEKNGKDYKASVRAKGGGWK